MFCTKCGSQLSDGTKFCTSCGTKVEVKEVKEETAVEPVKEETVAEEVTTEAEKETSTEEVAAEAEKETVAEEVAVKAEQENAPEESVESEATVEPAMVEPTTIEPTPVMNDSQPVMGPLDAPKKSGKAILVVAIGAVVVIVAAVLIYFLVLKNMFAYNNFKKAMEDNEYSDAKKISSELKGTKYDDDMLKLVESEIDELKESYKSGDIDLDEFQESIDALGKIKAKDVDDAIDEVLEFIKKIKESTSSYNEAVRIYKDAEDEDNFYSYSMAYESFKLVIEDDQNYEDAQSKMEECVDKIADHYIELADDDVKNGYYESAKSELDSAVSLVGEDCKKINDAYDALEDKVASAAIEKAQEYFDSYGASSALSTINSALALYPDNKELKDKNDEYVAAVVDNDFSYVTERLADSWWSDEEVASTISDYLDSNKDNEAYTEAFNKRLDILKLTLKAELAACLKAGEMYDAGKKISTLSTLFSDDESCTSLSETYKDYVSGVILDEASYTIQEGSVYASSYYTPDDETRKKFSQSYNFYVDTYSDVKFGEMTIDVADYSVISGFIAKKAGMNSNGKIVIYTKKDNKNNILLNVDLKKVNGDQAFNVSIPEGTRSLIVRWVPDNGESNLDFYLGDVMLTKKLYDSSADTNLAALEGSSGENNETTQEITEEITEESTETIENSGENDSESEDGSEGNSDEAVDNNADATDDAE